MTNKLIVETAHSRYVIDHETATYTRTRVHEKAADLSYAGLDDSPREFVKVSLPGVGERMTITHPNGTWVHSTTIQSITEGAA